MDNLHGGHQTVLAGDSQERKGRETSACMMAPERDLGLNPPSSQIPNCCQTLQEQKLRSWTLSPFAVAPSRLLAGPTESVEEKGSLDQSRSMDQEDLMRPTSFPTISRDNENGEGTKQQPLSKTAIFPRVRQETSSLDSTHVPQMLPSQAKARAIFHRQVLTFVTKVCPVAVVRQDDTVRHS